MEIMEYPFIKCLHPKKILNPYTRESLLVPCGKCEACSLQKSAVNTLKCQLECQSSRFNEFVTLTYSDEYVPQCLIRPVRDIQHFKYYDSVFDDIQTATLYKGLKAFENLVNYEIIDTCPRSDTFGMVLDNFYLKDLDFFALRKKVGYGDNINVLLYSDIKKFLKRLRYHINKHYGEKIRYYIAGEYGPKHYRPHWHIILSHNSEALAKTIRQIISSCWPFGRVDSSQSRGKCASYVAGYVNSSVRIPSVFKLPSTKPHCNHSIKLGEKVFEDGQETQSEQDYSRFIKRSLLVNDKPTDVHLWRSLTLRYFPRCRGYASLSHSERLEAYRFKITICQEYGIPYDTKHSDIARLVVDNIRYYNYNDAYIPIHLAEILLRYRFPCRTLYGASVDYDRLFNALMSDLSISQKFLDIVGSHDYSKCDMVLCNIESFYKYKELDSLNKQLKWQEVFFEDNSPDTDIRLIYTNIYTTDFDFDSSDLYNEFKELTLTRFDNSIKHKKLNDDMNVRQDN